MKILCLADHSSKIHDHIEYLTPTIMEHLIKCLLYPGTIYQKHWKQEIAAFYRINKSKSNNKFPSARNILKHTWYIVRDTTSETIRAIKLDYKQFQPANISNDTIQQALDEYFYWLADNLSDHGVIAKYEIYQKVEELKIKYVGQV